MAVLLPGVSLPAAVRALPDRLVPLPVLYDLSPLLDQSGLETGGSLHPVELAAQPAVFGLVLPRLAAVAVVRIVHIVFFLIIGVRAEGPVRVRVLHGTIGAFFSDPVQLFAFFPQFTSVRAVLRGGFWLPRFFGFVRSEKLALLQRNRLDFCRWILFSFFAARSAVPRGFVVVISPHQQMLLADEFQSLLGHLGDETRQPRVVFHAHDRGGGLVLCQSVPRLQVLFQHGGMRFGHCAHIVAPLHRRKLPALEVFHAVQHLALFRVPHTQLLAMPAMILQQSGT